MMLAPGTRLGPYEIESPLGAGGMGEVYRARDTRLERRVGIKVLSPQLAAAPQQRDRIRREASALSRLSHPHICTLFDIGEASITDDGGERTVSYLVMELLDGETLSAALARKLLPIDQALTFAVQIADALDKAHRSGIIHGDLKPGNIMVTKTGIKLLDFGLATQRAPVPGGEWTDSTTRTTTISEPNAVTGTLQYLAPEHLEGGASDERTDIFACGAVIYEMVTGRKAFDGHTPAAIIAAIIRHAPEPIAALRADAPYGLDHVIASCLAKDPEQRWQHAGDLRRELQWIAAGGAGAALVSSTPASGRRGWMAVTVLLLLTTLALAAYTLLAPAGDTAAATSRTSVVLPEGLRLQTTAQTVGGVGRFAISPDGRRLTFVATDRNGNQMLWLRPLDSLTATPIAGTEGGSSPFWSPDSRQIAFVARNQLKSIDPSGGTPLVISPQAFNVTGAWGPDDVILFTPSGTSGLHRIAASGGTSQPVTTLDDEAGDIIHRNPFLLPDGDHFLYVVVGQRPGATTGARAVYIGSLGGNEPSRLLIDSGTNAKFAQGHLIFLRDNALLAQPFDVGSLRLSGEAQPIAEQVALSAPASSSFSVSDTGVLAYQTATDDGSHLEWIDREGRQLGAVGEAAPYGDLQLSPDGRLAAVSVLDPALNTRDLWVVDLARGVRQRLTADRGDELSPIWSPDGARIAFASNRRGHFDLFVKAASGIGDEDLLQGDESEKYPSSWLPDGSALLYWAFGARGSGLSRLTLGATVKSSIVMAPPASQGWISPNGRWILYSSSESGRAEVYVVPYPVPSRKWQVSIAGGSLGRWRSDGTEIFYVGRDNKVMAVTVTHNGSDLDVGVARPLFEARPAGRGFFYDVAPDGQRFLVNVQQGESLSSSITIVQNWKAMLRP